MVVFCSLLHQLQMKGHDSTKYEKNRKLLLKIYLTVGYLWSVDQGRLRRSPLHHLSPTPFSLLYHTGIPSTNRSKKGRHLPWHLFMTNLKRLSDHYIFNEFHMVREHCEVLKLGHVPMETPWLTSNKTFFNSCHGNMLLVIDIKSVVLTKITVKGEELRVILTLPSLTGDSLGK